MIFEVRNFILLLWNFFYFFCGNYTINSCSNFLIDKKKGAYILYHVYIYTFYLFIFVIMNKLHFYMLCIAAGLSMLATQARAASWDLVDAINGVATGSVSTSTRLLDGDLGVIIYTILWLVILWVIIAAVRKFLK